MTTTQEPRRLTVWPEGKPVELRGDAHAPTGLQIKFTGFKWRTATTDECETVQIEERAEGLLEHEVLCCDSCLVDALLKLSGESFALDENRDLANAFGHDEIENLYPDPSDWTARQCRAWLTDQGHDLPNDSNPFVLYRKQLAEAMEDLGHVVHDDETQYTLAEALFTSIDAGDWGDVDDWREAVDGNLEPAEVYEWWRVSKYLCEELRNIGQPVLDNDYGYWWGRTCTGQQIIQDGTLQEVAAVILAR